MFAVYSLKSKILKYAKERYPVWINGAVFEELAFELGKKPSNASRRCRELIAAEFLENRLDSKGRVEYRARAAELPKLDVPKGSDEYWRELSARCLF